MDVPDKPNGAEIVEHTLSHDGEKLSAQVFDSLQNKYHMSGTANRCFLSTPELKGIFTETIISNILLQEEIYPEHQVGRVATQVLGPETCTVQIFTILILIGHVRYIKDFLRDKVYDRDLPLVRKEGKYELLKKNGFKECYLLQFCSLQWHVFVPVFDLRPDDIRVDHFPPKSRMPFLKKPELKSRGGQGKLWKIEVHANHFRAKFPVSACPHLEPVD